jgi:thioredoxin 1
MGNVVELTQSSFQAEVVESAIPVLVDFWAPWCGPCRRVAPLVDDLAQQYAGRAKFVKIDVDQSQELAGGYGVNSIPTLMIFKKGEVVDRFVGIPPKSRLDSALSEAAG